MHLLYLSDNSYSFLYDPNTHVNHGFSSNNTTSEWSFDERGLLDRKKIIFPDKKKATFTTREAT